MSSNDYQGFLRDGRLAIDALSAVGRIDADSSR
jgi:hypothetical protein